MWATSIQGVVPRVLNVVTMHRWASIHANDIQVTGIVLLIIRIVVAPILMERVLCRCIIPGLR